MRKVALALVIAVLPTWAAAQQTDRPPGHQKKAKPHSARNNPCAEYGVGFVQMPGSTTCIKIGGSIGTEAGGGSRR